VTAQSLKNPRQRVVGAKETLKQVLTDHALEVYVAQGANLKAVATIVAECERRHVPVFMIESTKALGEMCGIEVSAAAAALLRSGSSSGSS